MGLGVVAELVRLGVLSSTSDHSSVVSINLFVALLCACIVLGHLLEENRWVNESITALIIVSTHARFLSSSLHRCSAAAPAVSFPMLIIMSAFACPARLGGDRGCAPAW
jgi:hypothetical protein